MKRLKRAMGWSLVAGVLLSGGFVYAGGIDLVALTQETQRMSQKTDEITLAWWMPEEFWATCLAQAPDMTASPVAEFLTVIRPYTMVAVLTGTMGAFGGVTYKPEEWIRANVRLIDVQGNSYAPRTEAEVDANTKNMLQMLKPVLANMLGPMGQNLHFLLFPATTGAGARIAAAKETGQFKIKLGDQEFKWRLPLDALLPSKACPGCGQESKGSWSFCPWCGTKFAKEAKSQTGKSAAP